MLTAFPTQGLFLHTCAWLTVMLSLIPEEKIELNIKGSMYSMFNFRASLHTNSSVNALWLQKVETDGFKCVITEQYAQDLRASYWCVIAMPRRGKFGILVREYWADNIFGAGKIKWEIHVGTLLKCMCLNRKCVLLILVVSKYKSFQQVFHGKGI